ncbi:MAG TPA: DUF3107 domain-containing protein [Acidimicrobiales bacterium]
MNIRIGMIYTPKELEIELADDTGTQVLEEITEAVNNDTGMLWLTDRKGRRVGVATSKVAWVELGPESEGRRVGFSAL